MQLRQMEMFFLWKFNHKAKYLWNWVVVEAESDHQGDELLSSVMYSLTERPGPRPVCSVNLVFALNQEWGHKILWAMPPAAAGPGGTKESVAPNIGGQLTTNVPGRKKDLNVGPHLENKWSTLERLAKYLYSRFSSLADDSS